MACACFTASPSSGRSSCPCRMTAEESTRRPGSVPRTEAHAGSRSVSETRETQKAGWGPALPLRAECNVGTRSPPREGSPYAFAGRL